MNIAASIPDPAAMAAGSTRNPYAQGKSPKVGEKNDIHIIIIDIKRAFFYAVAQKGVYVRLPSEAPKSGDPNIYVASY